MAGRPSDYSIELAEMICEQIATTRYSLRKICEGEGMPDHATVRRWLIKHEDFRDLYARAKEEQADSLADEMLDAAFDEGDDEKPFVGGNHIQRDRLKVDTLKWIASKLKPKKYGDRIEAKISGNEDNLTAVPISVHVVSNSKPLPSSENDIDMNIDPDYQLKRD